MLARGCPEAFSYVGILCRGAAKVACGYPEFGDPETDVFGFLSGIGLILEIPEGLVGRVWLPCLKTAVSRSR